MSQAQKVINFLSDGREATTKQLAARFRLANVGAVIDNARKTLAESGMYIYNNRVKNSKGEFIRRYRMGKISARLAAAAAA